VFFKDLGLNVKVTRVTVYRGKAKNCELCGKPIKIGDIQVITSSGRHFHKECFEKLLH